MGPQEAKVYSTLWESVQEIMAQYLRLPSVFKTKELFLTSFKKKKARLPGATGRVWRVESEAWFNTKNCVLSPPLVFSQVWGLMYLRER